MTTEEYASDVLKEIYSGIGSRPSTDAEILNAVANWLDRIDFKTEDLIKASGKTYHASRAIQTDLRRIALHLTPGSVGKWEGVEQAIETVRVFMPNDWVIDEIQQNALNRWSARARSPWMPDGSGQRCYSRTAHGKTPAKAVLGLLKLP